jgi:hypothetical protein
MKKIFLMVGLVINSLMLFGQVKLNGQAPQQKLNEEYCSGLFQSTDGIIFDMDKNPAVGSYNNFLDWLDMRVAGLRVYKLRNGNRVPYIRGQVPGVFVDEQQVPLSYLNSLPTADIAMIKVIKTPFFGGFSSSNGAIAIYTYGTDEEEKKQDQ